MKIAQMLYLAIKGALSGIIVALVSEIVRRNPGAGGLLASFPLASVVRRFGLNL